MTIDNGRARPEPVLSEVEGGVASYRPADGSAIRPCLLLLALFIASCAAPDTQHHIVIRAREQKLGVLDRGSLMAIYPVSTSKFGLGDWRGSSFTPLGKLEIAQKIGDNAPPGAVFKDRRRTGEIVLPDSPGRDPIVTRILWLRGREAQNANAFARDIYIHGTPEERFIGMRAGYGCIRMRSSDIIQLYDIVGAGAAVTIVDAPLAAAVPSLTSAHSMAATNTAPFVMRQGHRAAMSGRVKQDAVASAKPVAFAIIDRRPI
jgi:lipoprotein-anchoring transpeptidase ErfK/SrfK